MGIPIPPKYIQTPSWKRNILIKSSGLDRYASTSIHDLIHKDPSWMKETHLNFFLFTFYFIFRFPEVLIAFILI